MCGIAGFFSTRKAAENPESVLNGMIQKISHRGPDGLSFWVEPKRQVGFAHARLSIIDLAGGTQPIFNETGDIGVLFNGEIFNYKKLREKLVAAGHAFKTQSDTEVLVHLYEDEGLDFVRHLRGHFAIGMWDGRKRQLVLARDHLGKKPLFYTNVGDTLYFASEYKAFLDIEGFRSEIDPEALHLFLNLRWVPGAKTLLKGVYQLLPGQIQVVGAEGRTSESFHKICLSERVDGRDYAEHKENVMALLSQAVERRLVADVPVGLFLSGGIDSTAILALMTRLYDQPVQSFTLGFNNASDETQEAQQSADYFGSTHTNFLIDDNPLRHLKSSVWHCEVPKVNSIQVYLLAGLARQKLKVVLSGLGGDELFGGYDNYMFIRYGGWLSRIPHKNLGKTLKSWVFKSFGGGDTLHRDQFRRGLEMGLSFEDKAQFYSILRNAWDVNDPMFEKIYSSPLAKSQREFSVKKYFEPYFMREDQDFLAQAIVCELSEKLVADQILVEERNMMGQGLEGRAPFLDLDLVDYAINIPTSMKISLMEGRKVILKDSLRSVLPDFVYTRPKKGFAFDPHVQFSRDLKPLAEQILNRERIESQGLFNFAYIDKILKHPPDPRLHWHYWFLWNMVGFQHWHDLFITRR